MNALATWRRVFESASPDGRRTSWPLAALTVVLLAAVAVAAFWLTRTALPVTTPSPQIVLTSHPYPLIVGTNTLDIRLAGADGAPLEVASVRVDSTARREGMLPLSRPATVTANGDFQAALTYPMMGEWDIDITAALANGETLTEHYDVYVYPVPPENVNPRETFMSASELAALPYDPAREVRIVIPQGTWAGIVGGHGDDVIDEEIRLSVGGRNTLVIRNDDIADHNVGPFFVRAGETLRQEFRRPAEYVGACSIRHGAEVSIIVEG